MKRTPLKRSGPLRRRRKTAHPAEDLAAKAAWKDPHAGYCACGCSRFTMHLERHHVVSQERIKQEGRWDLLWDGRNGMYLHPLCHARHTNAFRRIRIERVPMLALLFARELLGEAGAAAYLECQYNCEVTR